MVPARPRRHDDAAVAVVEDDVGAVGLGEAWRGLEEFLGIHALLWIYLEGGRRERISISVGWNDENRGAGRNLDVVLPPFQIPWNHG